jgi:hypothetical protein
MPLANYQQAHTFYREYFDKPAKVKAEQITFETLPRTPSNPTRARYAPRGITPLCRMIEEIRMPVKKRVQVKRHLASVQAWADTHSVVASKNNPVIHQTFKAFFDKPVSLDPNGYPL